MALPHPPSQTVRSIASAGRRPSAGRRSVITAVLAGGLSLLAACGGSARAPGCRIAAQTALPPGSLGDLPDARLERAGDDFVLVARAGDGSLLRFARLSADGVLGPLTTVPLPDRRAAFGPYWALTSKSAPGDQLLVLFGVPSSQMPGAIALQLIAASGGAPPSAPRPVIDATGTPVILPTAPAANGWTITLGPTANARAAVLTWGNTSSMTAPAMLFLDDTGVGRAPISGLDATPGPWSCLAVTQSRRQFGISRIVSPAGPDAHPAWWFAEFDDLGQVGARFNLVLNTREAGCPTVAPTTRGYTFTWQNPNGTYFADVDTTRPGGDFYTSSIAKGSVRFGAPDQQPLVASVTSSGQDFSLLFAGATPTMDRYSLQGLQQGSTLVLPADRRLGPLSAWSGPGSVFMTYFDQPAGRPTRRFINVQCPASIAE